MSDDFTDDLWVLFEAEALEHCTSCEDHLFSNDHEDQPEERLNVLFRAFHSLKSLASSMGVQNMVELAHACEDILGAARSSQISITPETRTGLIEATDLIRQLVILTVAQRKPAIVDGVVNCLEKLKKIIVVHEVADGLDNLKAAKSTALNAGIGVKNIESQKSFLAETSSSIAASDRFVRVASESLDNLFRLSGSLVANAALLEKITQKTDATTNDLLADNSQRFVEVRSQLEKVSRDIESLNTAVGDLRLVPLDDLARRLRRAAHDTALKVDKDIELNVDGEEMRADRLIVRTLTDPLLHMVRNAVDHGLEERNERGEKAVVGTVKISFSRSGSSLKILIQDDGRGLDVERIRRIATERQRLTSLEAKEMSDSQIKD